MEEWIAFPPFQLSVRRRRLLRDGMPVEIGGRALDILIALAERAGEMISRRDLEARAWPGMIVEEGNLRTQIAALRRVLGDRRGGTRYIASVRGRGYSLVVPVTRTTDVVTPAVATPLAAPPPHRRSTLPPRPDRIMGRSDEIADVKGRLLDGRFLSIVGPGGMGKTTLATRVAGELEHEFAGYVVFVDLASIEDPALVADAIAAALGVTLHAGDPDVALLAFLQSQRLLLVLDNCEHVIAAVAVLAERIHLGAPGVHLLATSREPLRVAGEQIHQLLPLASPTQSAGLTAAQAQTFPAVQLFMERAAAAGNRSPLSDAQAAAVAAICRRLDGIPLALELAAARVAAHGIEGTAELMDQRFKLLWEGRRTAPPRHHTLTTLLDWSYNLLTGDERATLRRLSVFVGTFSLEAARAVAGDAQACPGQMAEIIASLNGKSLIVSYVRDGRLRYRLLEVTREYAAGKLDDSSESEAVRRRHAAYFAGYELDPAIFPVYPDYLGNLRGALEWCLGRAAENDLLHALVHRLAPPLLRMSLLTECHTWCERALSSLPQADRGTVRELDLLKSLAICSMFTLGNDEAVEAVIRRALRLAEALADHVQRLQLLSGLNLFQIRTGSFEGALRSAHESAVVAHSLADPAALMIADWMLAVVHHLRGDQRLAQWYYERGLRRDDTHPQSLSQSFGYDHRVRALIGLARTLWLRGEADRAASLAQRACEAAAALGQPVSTCISLIYSATIHLWRGDWPCAEAQIDAGLAESRRHSLRPYEAVCTGLEGELLLRRGDPAAGIGLMRRAVDALTRERHVVLVPDLKTALAEALAATGQRDAALAVLEQAIAQRDASGASFDMPEMLRVKACILARHPRRRMEEAMALLDHAMQLARRQSAPGWELRIAISRVQARPDDDGARRQLRAIRARFRQGFASADLLLTDRLLDRAPAARSAMPGALQKDRRRRRRGQAS